MPDKKILVVNMVRYRLVLTLAVVLLASPESFSQWKAGEFQNPRDAFRVCTWYHWQNGHVDSGEVRADLESMKQVGLGGFTLFNTAEGILAGPLEYMGEGWWEAFRSLGEESKRLGLGMGVACGAGWSVSGGPWVKPEDSMKEVAWTEIRVQGPSRLATVLPEPEPCLGLERDMQKDSLRNRRYYVPRAEVAGYYRDIAVYAFPTPSGEMDGRPFRITGWWPKAGYSKMSVWEADRRTAPPEEVVRLEDIVDLTGNLGKDGSISWDVPPGTWTILRIGYQPTGRKNHPAAEGGSGLEVDKLSSKALDNYWNSSLSRILDASDAVSTVLVDSYEAGHQNWTEGFEDAFTERMGYDPKPYLPAVAGRVVGSVEQTESFLWDFRKVVGDLVEENFYGHLADLCHGKGVRMAVEPYGQFGNSDEYSTGERADILAGEFWAGENASSTNRATVKLASSLSHTRGLEVVGAEAFTNGGRIFEVYPGMLKTQGDYYFCLGMNQVWLHSYVHDPYGKVPGITLGYYGSHFNRRNTWWAYSRPWFDYLARCQYMLRQGESTADILYFMGEDSPSRPPLPETLSPAVPAGYDFDFCGGSAFLGSLKVRKGKIVAPSGRQYSLLVIRPQASMTSSTVGRIMDLARSGAVVFFEAPGGTPSLSDRATLPAVPRDIPEGGTSVGKGRVHSCGDLGKILMDNGVRPHLEVVLPGGYVPDATQYPGGPVVSIHRKGRSGDVFFISNQQAHRQVDPMLTFNVCGKMPEIWDPVSGSIRKSDDYEVLDDGRIRLRLHLDESGSCFVVFRKRLVRGDRGRRIQPAAAMPVAGGHGIGAAESETIALDSGWEISLLPGFSGGGKVLAEDGVGDLSLSVDSEARFHSGEILYRTALIVEGTTDRRFILDLGTVGVMAMVKVNGTDVGTLWCEPFRTDISDYLHDGPNDLEIKVVNLLYNRLAGDLQLPEDCDWTTETLSTAPGYSLARIPRWVIEGRESPTGRKTFTSWKWTYMKGKSLPPSGLVGPVKVHVVGM